MFMFFSLKLFYVIEFKIVDRNGVTVAAAFCFQHFKNAAVLETTHDLNRAALDADQIVALAQGAVAFDGPACEITSPQTLAAVFGVSFPTVPHPTTAVPMLVPVAASPVRSASDNSR